MSVVPFLLVAAATGTASLLVRASRSWSTAIALVGLVAMAVLATTIGPTTSVRLGGANLAGSDWLRLFAILGSLVGALLVIVDLATVHEPDVPGVIALGIGAAVLALAIDDPGAAVITATAGGLAGVLVAAPLGAAARAAFVGSRELRALAVAGALAIGATAWIARPLGDLSRVPEVFGLAYLAFAAAVAIRLGAIPFHLWAARVADAAPGIGLPLLMAWGPAAFAAVALVWIDRSVAPLALPIDGERSLVATIGALSVVLGLLAAAIQDDLEHVVGYTIAADAGFVVLALAGFDPAVWAPSRTWLLVFVVARSAFAAWAVAIAGASGTRRIPELDGWARRTPVLAVALVAIAAVSIGWPGLAAWDARAAIAAVALPDPIAGLVAAAPVAAIVIYGRLIRTGLRRAGAAVRAGRSDAPAWPSPLPRRPIVGRGTFERTIERISHALAGTLDVLWTVPAGIRLNRTLLGSVAVLVLAGLGGAVAAGGLGVPEAARAVPVLGEPGPGPEASGPPSATIEPGATPGFSFSPVGPGQGPSQDAGGSGEPEGSGGTGD
ncbi:MAG TPA: proton-conducting transporter membrane subunit [Candidatus Limnocylindrales bacterium]|nr:proton-conducting transporter membrane subunit [Candidatus Limnocylindrales bacterium]